MPPTGQQPEQVTLTIDGREVTVPKGTSLLHAAEEVGTEVPHYCYHPGLSAPAQCRLCLVEVEGAPKLQPSCVTMAQDGQVVHTDSPKARGMRTGVLEFYLVNHPLDCPICDQSGECKLQDFVFAEGREHGRGREPKRIFGRDDFGGDVLYYGDRCVMCTRCVRFMDEVARDSRLTVVERGNRSVIDTFFEEGLDGSPFHGNVVDICPVGALVSKDFLHKARAWDLDHTASICPNCSQGCNVELHTRDNMVQRLKPRENQEVNGHWMCDYGRMNYEWINRGDRYEAPLIRNESGQHRPSSWGGALQGIAGHLEELGSAAVEVVASPFWSTEGLGSLVELARATGSTWRGVYRSRRAEDETPMPGFPTLVRRRDLAPNVDGAELLGLTRAGDDAGQGGLDAAADHDGILIVLGDDLADQPETFGSRARLFVYAGTTKAAAAKNAHFILPLTTFAEQEGTFVNAQGRVQRFWAGVNPPAGARPAWLAFGALAAAMAGEGGEGPRTAAEAFARVAERTGALSDLRYDALDPTGVVITDGARV